MRRAFSRAWNSQLCAQRRSRQRGTPASATAPPPCPRGAGSHPPPTGAVPRVGRRARGRCPWPARRRSGRRCPPRCPVGLVHEDDVDVANVVQFPGPALAHADHGEPDGGHGLGAEALGGLEAGHGQRGLERGAREVREFTADLRHGAQRVRGAQVAQGQVHQQGAVGGAQGYVGVHAADGGHGGGSVRCVGPDGGEHRRAQPVGGGAHQHRGAGPFQQGQPVRVADQEVGQRLGGRPAAGTAAGNGRGPLSGPGPGGARSARRTSDRTARSGFGASAKASTSAASSRPSNSWDPRNRLARSRSSNPARECSRRVRLMRLAAQSISRLRFSSNGRHCWRYSCHSSRLLSST